MNIFTIILIAVIVSSCSGFSTKESEADEFNAKGPENETFFIDAETDSLSTPIKITDNSIHLDNGQKESRKLIYKVIEGDTLGIIAVKIFGDFRRWRHIFNKNKEIIPEGKLLPGTNLSYDFTETDTWTRPLGSPYLVLKDDTLGLISRKVYKGEEKYWRYIWKNNKKLIYDPNLIFTGFTIFYLPLKNKENLAKR